MKIDGFIWLPDIIDKLARKHHVGQDEVEEVFFNHPRYWFVERGYCPGEDVYAATGQTDAGRYVIVFFIHKETKLALILSARDMDRKERRRHERK
ncbi:MAG: BrnT family toxin [Desulfurellaceae bacterium]|nr:BrnT family toxin [Desulfurellaceae bacterium]